MMSSGSSNPQTADNGSGGNKRIPCSLFGCKRVYTDMSALESHVKDHELPAQSVPGKVLLCSTVGCTGSFPNMQKLMEHTRHHHKLNVFFQCESCRTKLRSYRGLLTHLHSCSKVPRGKPKLAEPTPAAPAAATNAVPAPTHQQPPQLESVSTPQQAPTQIPNPDGSFPAAISQPESATPPLLGPPSLPLVETSPPQLPDTAPPPLLTNEASNGPPPLNLDSRKAAPAPPDAQGHTPNRSAEPVHPAPAPAPHSPPGSAAIWKKNQGVGCSRRILWEHTRGRYTCVQCGHTVTNRKEMTQHINSQHSGNKAAEDAGNSATSA